MAIWFYGPSGSGKSTLVHSLQRLLHCDILNVGEILRANYPPRAILGNNIPESEIFQIVADKMGARTTNLILVDNFPINDHQLRAWEKCYDLPIIVFLLTIDDAGPRKLARKRIDDTLVMQATRKLHFHNHTLPLIGYLETRSVVITLDASKLPRQLVQETFQCIRQEFIAKNINFADNSQLIVEKSAESSVIPTKKYPFSGGYDISLTKSIIIGSFKTEVHSLEIFVEIPARCVALICNRSSTASRGLHVHNGIVDTGYSGSLKLILTNLTSDFLFIDHEIPIAQILLLPILCPHIVEASTIKTTRGGFGSSNGRIPYTK